MMVAKAVEQKTCKFEQTALFLFLVTINANSALFEFVSIIKTYPTACWIEFVNQIGFPPLILNLESTQFQFSFTLPEQHVGHYLYLDHRLLFPRILDSPYLCGLVL
jgi:hypothetical protein